MTFLTVSVISVVIFLSTVSYTHGSVQISIYPESLKGSDVLYVDRVKTVYFNVTCDSSCSEGIAISSLDDDVASITGNVTYIKTDANTYNGSFTVQGNLLGRTLLKFTLKDSTGRNQTVIKSDYQVDVLRIPKALDTVFTVVVAILVGLNTIGFGCKLDLKVIKEILKKPSAPVVGFVCQYVGMPMIAFSLTKIFGLSDELGLGLFAIGCSPGGGSSNIWTILLDGDINLSLTMTFISTTLSLGMMPLWLFTLGRIYLTKITIPYTNIIISIVSLVVPGGIGILLKYKVPKVAKKISKFIKPMSLLIVLFVLTVGVYSNLYMFKLMGKNWKILVSGLLLPYGGYIIAAIVSWVCRQPWVRIKTIVFETGIQNTGIPIVLLRFSLPQPEADLSSVMPVAGTMFTTLPWLIIFIILTIRRKCCPSPDDDKDEKDVSLDHKETEKSTNGKYNKRESKVALTQNDVEFSVQ